MLLALQQLLSIITAAPIQRAAARSRKEEGFRDRTALTPVQRVSCAQASLEFKPAGPRCII